MSIQNRIWDSLKVYSFYFLFFRDFNNVRIMTLKWIFKTFVPQCGINKMPLRKKLPEN